MPANRGITPDWRPRPDVRSLRQLSPAYDNQPDYVPKNLKDCAEYIAWLCLPEIDVYDDESGTRSSLAACLAKTVFKPGLAVLPEILEYRQQQNSPAATQDLEHERLIAMLKAQRFIDGLQKNASGHSVESAKSFVAVSIDGPEIESAVVVSEPAKVRSFG